MTINRLNRSWTVRVGTILCCLVACGVSTLKADTITAVDPVEGLPFAFSFTITNGRSVPITITSLAPLPQENLDPFERDDKVTRVFVNDVNCTQGMILPGKPCTFIVTIATADNSGKNDHDFGTWRVGAKVFSEFTDPVTHRTDFAVQSFTTDVHVTDPVPEPATLTLLCLGSLGLLGYGWRYRRFHPPNQNRRTSGGESHQWV
jgi:hypothetical protein